MGIITKAFECDNMLKFCNFLNDPTVVSSDHTLKHMKAGLIVVLVEDHLVFNDYRTELLQFMFHVI